VVYKALYVVQDVWVHYIAQSSVRDKIGKHKVMCKQAEEIKSCFEENGCRTVEEIDAQLEKVRMKAELGDADSQYLLGYTYSTG
jgi:hypothetical protein